MNLAVVAVALFALGCIVFTHLKRLRGLRGTEQDLYFEHVEEYCRQDLPELEDPLIARRMVLELARTLKSDVDYLLINEARTVGAVFWAGVFYSGFGLLTLKQAIVPAPLDLKWLLDIERRFLSVCPSSSRAESILP